MVIRSLILFGLISLSISCKAPTQKENHVETIRIEQIWETGMGGLGFPSTYPPGYSDGIVFSCVSSNGIKAFRSTTGELLWQNEYDPGLTSLNTSRFAIEDERIYVNMEGYLHCFNKYTGEHLFDIRNGCSKGTVIDGDVIYVENDLHLPHELISADKMTGEINWSVELFGRMWEPPAVEGQYLYISMMRLLDAEVHGRLYKVDKSSGEIIYEIPVHPTDDDTPSSGPAETPVFFENLVIIESGDTRVYAYDKDTADLVWVYYHGGAIRHALLVENGILYFATQDGWMVALDAGTGEVVWKDHSVMWGSCTKGPVAIYEDYLFTQSSDDYMHCFLKTTGMWIFKEPHLWSPTTHLDTIFVGGAHSIAEQYMSAYKIIVE